MDINILEKLVCPICKGKLIYDSKNMELICQFDHLAYPIREGIPIMLGHEARRVEKEL